MGSAVALYYYYADEELWTERKSGRAVAFQASPGSTITISGGTCTVNGKPVRVPNGTYTEGIVANEHGTFVAGQKIA